MAKKRAKTAKRATTKRANTKAAIPATWTNARVRVNSAGKVQIAINRPKKRTAK
jgi:hypothetical protein